MLSKDDLHQLVQDKLGDYQFIVVANREPYEHVFKKGRIECRKPSGGVVTALDPVMQASNGLWIAAGSGDADRLFSDRFGKVSVPVGDPKYTLKRIWLTKEEEKLYYYGYANDALWPLCHMAFQRPVFAKEDWDCYVSVNRRFAESIMEEIGGRKAFIWVQDYHLCLLPKMIKEMAGDQVIIAHFWHIPWPSYEVFRICPHKDEILEGLLANDLIGFHTHYHCNNFIEVVDRHLESKIDRERFSITRRNHETMVRPYPISVDFAGIDKESAALDMENVRAELKDEFGLGDTRIIVGVDRIDYTKGIKERLQAIDRLFTDHPELKGEVTFLQIGVLSRIFLGKYKELNDAINALVQDINWKHGKDGWHPIVFVRTDLSLSRLLGVYRMADVAIVSSLHDGMNLVSKEFVSARADGDGVLVLSEFAGSARELSDAILINPYDSVRFAEGIYQALTMPEEERRRRMGRMRQVVSQNNIFRWAAKVLSGLLKIEFKEQERGHERPASIAGPASAPAGR